MPTPDCGASDRPSIRRPALMSTGGAAWAVRDACAQAGVATARVANRVKRGRIAVSLWGEANLLVTASLSSLRLGHSRTEATVAVRVTCQCGTSYELKDEFAGRLVKCPQCGRENRVPGLAAATAVKPQADAVFDRDVFLFRDQTKRGKLLEVLQDRKWQPITATFTVRDAAGRPLALLRKNYLFNLVRKRWYVNAPNGTTLYMAKEDSIILSLLRRLLGPLFGLLRTNFVIVRGDSDDVVGEFNRKFTILDRYVLDLKADRNRLLDRRVALALGVMLDTGERR